MSDAAPPALPTVETWYDAVVIRINGLVHAHIKLLEYLGFQSWADGPHNYKFEFQMKGGAIQLHTVRLDIDCGDAMAAGIVYEDMAEQAKKGNLRLTFTIGKITEE